MISHKQITLAEIFSDCQEKFEKQEKRCLDSVN